MTVAQWPFDLPRPLRSGWQAQSQDPRRIRQRETGPAGLARRYTSVARTVGLVLMLDRVQRDIFDRFHDQTLSFGSLPFWMPDPTTDGWPLLAPDGSALLTPEGTPLLAVAQWLCQMGQEPPLQGPIKGQTFQISFSVEVLP